MSDIVDALKAVFELANLQGKERKDAIREFVAASWGDLPPWSTLDAPVIEEVQKASVGSGVVLTFWDDEAKQRMVVLAEAGEHYGTAENGEPRYTIPGGFINLSAREGSSKVEASINTPENQRIGAAREIEEEFKKDDGSPLLEIDPDTLKPMDMDVINAGGQPMVVQGLVKDLNKSEVADVKAHVLKLASDESYRAAVASQTINPASQKPEVSTVKILPLDEMAAGKHLLLHPDQASLFKLTQDHYAELDKKQITPRKGPTSSYKDKVKSLEGLSDIAAGWKADGLKIGITSGVFDIPHPGHISFLEDSKAECDVLIAVIASNRTVTEQKGEERPFINELKRAQTIAGLQCVDAVIISDEYFHESILAAIQPDIMFKGHDYAGKDIIGADMVGEVRIILCAEDNFFSSSRLIQSIKNLERDQAPDWSP